jgi:protoporphyrinogen oxidase
MAASKAFARKRIAIVGAGVAGLAAAHDLQKAGCAVTIYEAAPQVGGLAAGFKAAHWDWTLEKFYHHWFAADKDMFALIDELGWSDKVIFRRPWTVVYYKNRFQALDSYVEAVKFTLRNFGPVDLVRFGLVGVYLKLTSNWKALEQHTADSWLKKWVGPRVYNAIWRPMLVGKFGEANLDVVNAAWFWARVKARTTRLGTFQGGFQRFLDALADNLRCRDVDIRLNTAISGIHKENGGLLVETEAGAETYDAVISTSSPALMAKLAPDLSDSYSAALRHLKSMGAVVLVVSLDRSLSPYYWHNLPKDAGFPFLALVEHTNFMDREHYGGDTIIYCGDYLETDHENFSLSKEQLLDKFLPAFKRFNPDFDPSWVKDAWLWKTAYAQPIPPVNHSQNIPPLRTPVPGLYFASMSQVYPWDRGTNYAVEIGRRVAGMAVRDLGLQAPER